MRISLTGHVHVRRSPIPVSAIAFVHLRVGHGHARDTLHGGQCFRKRVSVVRVVGQPLGRRQKVIKVAATLKGVAADPVAPVGRRHRHLLPELLALVRLALADAPYLRLVKTVPLVRVLRLLLSYSIRPREQRTQRFVHVRSLAANVADQSPRSAASKWRSPGSLLGRPEGAQLAQRSLHPLELPGVCVTTDLHRRDLTHPQVRWT